MSLFTYKVITKEGDEKSGTIDAINEDVAISSLQRRGFIIVSLAASDDKPFLAKELTIFGGVSNKDIVILSRQIATLFEGASVRIARIPFAWRAIRQ